MTQQSTDVVDEKKLVTGLTGRAIDRLLKMGESKLRYGWAKYKNRAEDSFSSYLLSRKHSCMSVRNFIYDNKSADLTKLYVPMSLVGGDTATGGDQFFRSLATGTADGDKPARFFIRGQAGAGKSFFLRQAFLYLLDKEADLIPIFIELRDLNGHAIGDFREAILHELGSTGQSFLPEQINDALASGLFLILLDGFDELDPEIERSVEKKIGALSKRFPRCPIVITGRPQQLVKSWSSFDVLDLQPLSLAQTIELIEKLDFDNEVKTQFIDQVGSTLQHTHKEFLSIPLFAIIMLLTFADVGTISSQQHEFFEDAFNALWNKHDSRKQGFERKRYSGLQKSEFLFALSAFAASSYVQNQFNFSDKYVETCCERAAKLTGLDFSAQAFFKDASVSTSLVVPDGYHYRFVHRMFHEFFTAVYINMLPDELVPAAVSEISTRQETDRVLDFCISLNGEKVEKQWIIPSLEASVMAEVVPEKRTGFQQI